MYKGKMDDQALFGSAGGKTNKMDDQALFGRRKVETLYMYILAAIQ